MSTQRGGAFPIAMPAEGGPLVPKTLLEAEQRTVQTLQQENERLKALLNKQQTPTADDVPHKEPLRQLNSANGSPSTSAGAGKKQSKVTKAKQKVEDVKLVYSVEGHGEFTRGVRKASRIQLLDISSLRKNTNNSVSLFGTMVRRPDKKVDQVLAALMAGPSEVEELDLGDAMFATDTTYCKELLKVLRKYKPSVRRLSITNRALVQSCGNPDSSSAAKANTLQVVSTMPHLEELEITFVTLDLHYSVYASQFHPNQYGFDIGASKRQKTKTPFPALKEIDLILTQDWFDNQFGSVDDCCGDEYDWDHIGGGGGREEYEDDMIEHILTNKGHLIKCLDISGFQKTRVDLPIVDLFKDLKNVASLAVQGELLDVAEKMSKLSHLCVVLDVTLEEESLRRTGELLATTPSAPTLASIAVEAKNKRGQPPHSAANVILATVAQHCKQLRRLQLTGDDWDVDALTALIGDLEQLEEVQMGKCGALRDEHLHALAAKTSLRSAELPCELQKSAQNGVAELQKKGGVAIKWTEPPKPLLSNLDMAIAMGLAKPKKASKPRQPRKKKLPGFPLSFWGLGLNGKF